MDAQYAVATLLALFALSLVGYVYLQDPKDGKRCPGCDKTMRNDRTRFCPACEPLAYGDGK